MAGARNRAPRGGGGRGSAVSKVSCPREAKDCGGGGGGGQRACISSRPCALLPAALPSSAARSLLRLPAEPSVQPRACLRRPGRGPRLLPRARAGLSGCSLGAGRGEITGEARAYLSSANYSDSGTSSPLPTPGGRVSRWDRANSRPPPLAFGHLQWARRSSP